MEKPNTLSTQQGTPILFQKEIEDLRELASDQNFIAQKGAQEYGLSQGVDITIFGGNRGGGKANWVKTPVATPTGFKLMGDLKVGDEICTPYDGIQKVKEIFEQGVQPVYQVKFDDGSEMSIMDNHRLWARLSPFEDFREMSAREIFNQYVMARPYPISLRKGKYHFVEIPLCGEVQMTESRKPIDLPVSPFLMGCVVAYGKWNLANNGFRVARDSSIGWELQRYGAHFSYSKDGKWVYIKGLSIQMAKNALGIINGQYARIPEMYMTASIEARWQFLRGIIWRSGKSLHRRPCVEVISQKLAEDIAQLARSLGCWAQVSQVQDDPLKFNYWRIFFVCHDDSLLFQNEFYRKKALVNGEPATSIESVGVLTKKIIYVKKKEAKQPCRCITITGKDHLYLTDAWTINHNTVTMLMEPLYDIQNKLFNGIIFRKNKDDFENIINESKRWFSELGRYNKSKEDMTWYFYTGAKLGLTIYDMSLSDFDTKFRGQQFAYIGIDELPQMPFEMFKFLMTANRNTYGAHSRILGTCNPDPLSWLRKFVDWWIGKEDTIYSDGLKHPERKGFAIPERDGVVRYCYMPDDSVDNIIWGNTPEEVYEQCRDLIDDAWNPEWEQYGYTKTSFFVKSVTFIKASLNDNKALLKNDPGYIASLLNQPLEVRAREFEGNWDIIKAGDSMIQAFHLDKVFQNANMLGDGVRRATCDVAGTGGDNCVTWLWVGWHVADVFVCRRDPYITVELLRAKLREWGVLEQNFCYDLNGMGQVLKGAFPLALPFNNQEAVNVKDKGLYDNIKSQCAYKFAIRTQQTEWSIESSLLSRKYSIGKSERTLYDILQLERRCVKQDMSKEDKGWCLIHKEQMKNKAIVGHSPDFFESLFMRESFELKSTSATVPGWLQKSGHIRGVRKLTRFKKHI